MYHWPPSGVGEVAGGKNNMTPEEKTNQPQPESQNSENKTEGGDIIRDSVESESSEDQTEKAPTTEETPESTDKSEDTTGIEEAETKQPAIG
jgi:hypothetical protein